MRCTVARWLGASALLLAGSSTGCIATSAGPKTDSSSIAQSLDEISNDTPVVPLGTLDPTTTLPGTLTTPDRQLSSGHYVDTYSFACVGACVGSTIRVALESTQLDTYLEVIAPTGERTPNDDFAPPSTDSQVEVPGVVGTYYVKVKTFYPGQLGDYVATIELIPPPRPSVEHTRWSVLTPTINFASALARLDGEASFFLDVQVGDRLETTEIISFDDDENEPHTSGPVAFFGLVMDEAASEDLFGSESAGIRITAYEQYDWPYENIELFNVYVVMDRSRPEEPFDFEVLGADGNPYPIRVELRRVLD